MWAALFCSTVSVETSLAELEDVNILLKYNKLGFNF